MCIENCKSYRNLLAAVEHDEATEKNPGTRYRDKLQWIVDRVNHYAEKTGLEAVSILEKWELRRDYWYMNYYQDSNQPLLNKKVKVFDNQDEFYKSIKDKNFRCPYCGGVSESPYECTSGITVDAIDGNKKVCDWKAYGLFGDLGKGVHVFIKEIIYGRTIFMPIAWES